MTERVHVNDVVLVLLLLIHTFFSVSIVDFEQLNVSLVTISIYLNKLLIKEIVQQISTMVWQNVWLQENIFG